MKPIPEMTNEELIKAYNDKNTPYDKSLLIVKEGFDRFRYYLYFREIGQYDTAEQTYLNEKFLEETAQ